MRGKATWGGRSEIQMTKCSRRLLSSCDLFSIQSMETSGETAYLLHGSKRTLADGGDAELFGLRWKTKQMVLDTTILGLACFRFFLFVLVMRLCSPAHDEVSGCFWKLLCIGPKCIKFTEKREKQPQIYTFTILKEINECMIIEHAQ